MSQREEHVRDISVCLLVKLRDKFPQVNLYFKTHRCHYCRHFGPRLDVNWSMQMQVLWNSSCLDSLLFSVNDATNSAVINDPGWVATVRSLFQKVIREWITNALSYAPCTTQGLLQVFLANLYICI